MYTGTIKSRITVNASNFLGWRTDRKIVVIESDDWGSIRTPNKKAYNSMVEAGLNLNKSNYTAFDCLESNSDLEELFGLLTEFKDSTGRPPVFTPMCIIANPDFEKIRLSEFEKYYYECVSETCGKYPDHNRVMDLWRLGKSERLFVSELHGREHLNVSRWMKSLKNGNIGMLIAFDHFAFGANNFKSEALPEHLGAFHPESKSEIHSYIDILKTASELFYKILAYHPKCFIAPNKEDPKEVESYLHEIGIKYLTRSKLRSYPLGNGKFKKEINWLGKVNKLNQICLIRNCFFEPSSFGEFPSDINWVDNCLKEMNIAFSWHKPAVIISHRVNYVGTVDINHRDDSLRKLKELLTRMLKIWPEIEFMTSEELGDLITESRL